jgi:hypothetical protein
MWRMTDPDLSALRARAADGDRNALDQLVELAGERGDMDELRRLADSGSSDLTYATFACPTRPRCRELG